MPTGIKMRIIAERQVAGCIIRCEGESQAVSLHDFLKGRFPGVQITRPQPANDAPYFEFELKFDKHATAYRVREALLQFPKTSTMELYDVKVRERPHYRISAKALADWLEKQPPEPWWTVDGDPLLMSRLAFPAPADELAKELRRIGRPVLAAGPSDDASDEELSAETVDSAVSTDEWGNRMLLLSWEDGAADWQLIQDEPIWERSGS